MSLHILWIVFGLIGAIWIFWDTRNQGYTFPASFRWAIGTFLVPAAVIPLYLMQSNLKSRQKPPRGKPQDVTSEMFQRCNYCGEFYQGNPEHCPKCKRLLKED
ncbi:hypothetical protein P6N53_09555 [Desulforamulus aquiferis]|uniref:Zinc ribbon domain-containing protein n=1 Tax=Desulforamulus aquiferis TaxID=1397668 RepID=A0AAW7ZCQ0_9FIRM|nr:hypothetical protein [Desulforamulus aquiferis]